MTSTLTKRQLEMIIKAWNIGEVKIPSKGKDTVVEFPHNEQYSFRKVIITKTDMKSSDGRVLYGLSFKNPIPT